MRSPTVALVEPFGEGHHPMYVAGYWQAFQEIGCRTLFVGPRQVADDAEAAFPVGRCVIPADRRVHWDPVGEGRFRGPATHDSVRSLWRRLVAVLEERPPDLAFMLSLDSFVPESSPALGVGVVPWRFSGLWFRPPTAIPGTLREAARRVLRFGQAFRPLRSAQCAPVLVLDDPSAIHHLRGYARRGVIAAPEFSTYERSSEPTSAVSAILRGVAGRTMVALVGSLEPRKGVRNFLRAAAAADPSQWAFVLAGKLYRKEFDDETLAMLDDLADGEFPRVFLHDGWMHAAELNDIVASADLIFLCYNKWKFSTNMLCKTSFFGVPVIAYDEGYVGREVRRHGLGMVVSGRREVASFFCRDDFSRDIEALRRSPAFRRGCRDYLAMNSVSALAKVLPALFGDGSGQGGKSQESHP